VHAATTAARKYAIGEHAKTRDQMSGLKPGLTFFAAHGSDRLARWD
jgi:hypothetical protein